MNVRFPVILLAIALAAGLFVPGVPAVDPLWTEAATTSGELSCVVISGDGSTIVAGGDQLIALNRDGRKIWSGWSGSHLAISRDGNALVSSRDQIVRLISGTGTMIWDETLTVPVNEVDIVPDASLIAIAGGSRIRLMSSNGTSLRQNTSVAASHLRLFPDGNMLVVTSQNGVHTANLTLFSEWTDSNMSQDYVGVAGDGSSFVTVTYNRIRFYTRDGNLLWERALPGGNALSFAYSRDGSTIIIGRDDNTIEALDRDGNRLWTAQGSYWITSVAVSDDGNTIAAGSLDRSLSVYDRTGKKLGSSVTKNPIRAGSVAVTGDGSLIVVVDSSAVYGFSRSEFTQPEIPAVTTEVPAAVSQAPPVTTAIPVQSSPATPPPGTQKASLSFSLPFALFAILCLGFYRKP